MVAHEVRVTATGASSDKNAVDRQLFTEETTSVLVCETGGVIQLAAAVSPGQLLFLANVASKREVVVQVKRKRAYRPTLCYVELEFAEAAPRFWDMAFSAASALLPKNALDAKTAETVVAAEATADEPGELPAAPTTEELEAFKRDVAALRGQPVLAQAPSESVQTLAPESAPPVTQSVSPPIAETTAAMAAEAVPGAESSVSTGANYATGSGPAVNALPVEHSTGPAQWPAEDQMQLPQPSLDFSMSLPKRKRSLRARGSFTPNFRGGVLRLALLTAALVVTAVGAAWFKHWLPWQSGAIKTSSSRSTNAANANNSLPPGSSEAANQHADFSNTRVASDAPVTSAGMPSPSSSVSGGVPSEPTDAAEPSKQPIGSSGSEREPGVRKSSSSVAIAAKRSPDRTTTKPSSNSVAPPAESEIVPPKLIKSVRAVASLEALRDFETGNVVIDAVVGTAGEVNFISVISGPPSLRPAAVESLKEYRYEPATRNGQPVPAHVTITIHFRFEP
jgi:hypothetical protein